jgi:uncharacterized protein (DUF362 family)
MKRFVNIGTVYNDNLLRRNGELSMIYNDRDGLKAKIREVSADYLDKALIQGKNVLLKPNWVNHNVRASDEFCLRTNDKFVLALLEIILELEPAKVVIGDAPIQGCNWEQMISESFTAAISALEVKSRIPIEVRDFRRTTFNPNLNNLIKELNPMSNYLIFDVGRASLLEPITIPHRNLFRVTYYNPDCLAKTHQPGIHKYCIVRELFSSDVVISLPKVKTHQKVGLTAALKNLVGLNGDKNFLPHHRLGGTGFGGDCYPGKNYLSYLSELARDEANRKHGKWQYRFWQKVSGVLWRLSFPDQEHSPGASWYGNDTAWRMVLDLNLIAEYGRSDGSIASLPQRKIFSLCDGIIGGQGNGPLNPDPLPLGVVTFTNHSGMHDVCMGMLMKFDINRIPLLATAAKQAAKDEVLIFLNGENLQLDSLANFAIDTIPPPGWLRHLKM